VSQLPRNPRYFPKMKVRGAGRRRIAIFHRSAHATDSLNLAFSKVGSVFASAAASVAVFALNKTEKGTQ